MKQTIMPRPVAISIVESEVTLNFKHEEAAMRFIVWLADQPDVEVAHPSDKRHPPLPPPETEVRRQPPPDAKHAAAPVRVQRDFAAESNRQEE